MRLSQMQNIGKTTERQLIEAGVETPEQLTKMGSREAFLRIRSISDPDACVRVLYGLEGAVRGIRDTALPEDTKAELLAFFRSL